MSWYETLSSVPAQPLASHEVLEDRIEADLRAVRDDRALVRSFSMLQVWPILLTD